MSEATWYYAAGGQQQGPTTVEALIGMIQHGQLTASDLVWRDGMANWLPTSQVPELAGAFGGSGAAVAAAPAGAWQQPQPAPGTMPQPPYPAAAPGTPYYPDPSLAYGAAGKSYKGMGIGAFVCSLVGLLFCGVVLGIVAIVLGSIALNGMKTSGNRDGRGLSIAAVVIGVLDIIAGIIITIVFVGLRAHNGQGF